MEDQDATFLRRQGFWLRAAREYAGKNQAGAAKELGLSENSKSSISDYENGRTPASQLALRKLARYYGVPVSMFTNPRPTPDETIAEIVQLAGEQEREDWERGEGRAREGGDELGGGRGRRSA